MGRMMKLIFVLLTTTLSTTAGMCVSDNRIANGVLATPGQFPYVVSITENGRHFCGGFIYSSRYIVTAASCVEGKQLSALNAVVGQLSTISPDVNEQIMNVYTVTIFPEYNSTNKINDIALIRLTADIQFDNVNVDFIVYNEASANYYGQVMGWGATFEGGYESVHLRYGWVIPQITNATSRCGGFLNTEFDYATTICAGPSSSPTYPGGSACQYDEGSPLIQDFVDPDTSKVITSAVGIFSKTKICTYGVTDSVGIYTRLSAFYSWLQNTAGQQPVRSHIIR